MVMNPTMGDETENQEENEAFETVQAQEQEWPLEELKIANVRWLKYS
jgi:hypothetical protein